MKKILIALAAVAALAACSKSEVAYEQPGEIGIAPFAQNRTKAMVQGTAFPQENFALWAFYKQVDAGTTIADWQSSAEAQQPYIENKEFKPSATAGLWGGVIPYFWPKIGSLLFAGYYPVTMKDMVSYEFSATVNKMTVAGYTPGDYQKTGFVNNAAGANHVEDFMYFNMTKTSSDGSTVGAQNSVTTGSQIDVFFRHGLSWISVVLAEAAGTPEGATITVNSITFTDVKTTGTGVVDNSATDNEIDWTTTDAKTDVVVLNSATVLGDAVTVDKQPIIIPQGMAGNLVINYTVSSTDGSSFTETKTIALAEIDKTNPTWEPGKKYTYNVTIGTSEILIDPIILEWADVQATLPVE